MNSRIRVASDVGGTFTDSIAYDEDSRVITVSKVSTTPDNRARGTVEGLRKAVGLQGGDGQNVVYVGHGMTTATNAVIQRKGARTAFLTNTGFRDLLLIGRQNRPTLFDLQVVRPEQLVPQELCFTAAGRIGADGAEIAPLSEEDVRAAGRANQRYPLLFRDYLRAHPASAAAYAELKRRLAANLRDLATYPDVKDPACDLIMVAAEEWARQTHWELGSSDA